MLTKLVRFLFLSIIAKVEDWRDEVYPDSDGYDSDDNATIATEHFNNVTMATEHRNTALVSK